MYRYIQIRLFPEDDTALRDFQRRFNAACNKISAIAFTEKIWNWFSLHKKTYRLLREQNFYSYAAQAIIRRVSFAYRNKNNRNKQAVFNSTSSVVLVGHRYKKNAMVKFYGYKSSFKSDPRIHLSSQCEATLIYRNGKWIINQALKEGDSPQIPTKDFLGVDLGIINIAVDSDGNFYSGKELNTAREHHQRLRARLQSKNTKSSKRLLKKRSGKEKRFTANVNHVISKSIVTRGKDTLRGIALEDLKGTSKSITVRKPLRSIFGNWSFYQLRMFIEYKANRAGIPVIIIDRRGTSTTCPQCGYSGKINLKANKRFRCDSCGYSGHSDYIAAINISARGRTGSAARGQNPILICKSQ